ncbi:MAG: phosphoribosylformylglycinamidine cyclo-ligase [Kiritimatiellae bacterium]|jgi:phosphoribosylformylglycinamidine cyclo-ligase|nr:phosphoribosylformylglycinamidine cyclo-ligase [Kiritimatiellia bacterium]MBR3775976.1 phosphoribosylformylglycinamidine cyclo-ligase [Kiritimatiellia bacterium]
MAKETKSAYAQAGVNIDVKMNAVGSIKQMVASTKTANVIGGIGAFGGLHKVPTGKGMILVSSADGVGTKLKVAAMMNKHDTVGQDIVNHCVNDILVQGAKPLFFMDYIGTAKVDPVQFKNVVSGLCKACKENKMALLGGETAEMPGLYPAGEYDLVGTIVGCVKKSELITGKSIRAGDVIIGFPSGGLQTNGFSLARRVIFDLCQYSWKDKLPGTNQTFGEALLAVHKSFLKPVAKLLERKIKITGMAHITGGGFPDNIPRVLPKAVNAEIDRSAWEVPTIFKFIQNQGKVDRDEMYRVFNMGIGYVVILPKSQLTKATNILKAQHQPYSIIGVIRKGTGVVTYKN